MIANDPTNWDPSKVQGIVAGILAKYPDLKGISYEDALFMSQGGYAAYKAAGIPYQGVFTYRTDESAMGCLADKLKDPKLKVFYYTAGNSQIRIALTADMMKLARERRSRPRSSSRSSCRTRPRGTCAPRDIRPRLPRPH